jgi:hypothetical protein
MKQKFLLKYASLHLYLICLKYFVLMAGKYGSMIECSTSICEVLDSTPSIAKAKNCFEIALGNVFTS